MKSKSIALILDNNLIYINGVVRLTYDNSNLPKKYFQFSTKPLPCLVVEQVSYARESGTLTVRVIDYSPPDNYQIQEEEFENPIHRIEFEKMDWNKFSPLVYSYTLSQMEEMFFNPSEAYSSASPQNSNDALKQQTRWNAEHLRNIAPHSFAQESRMPIVEQIPMVVKVKFEDAMFGDGQITFKAKLKDYKVIRDFSVANENLRSEFENIKPWFVKRIGKSFIVTIHLKLVDGQIDDAIAFSEDISTINNEMIESIKTQRVLMLVKTARIKDDNKAVFDKDEVFGVLDEGQGTNVFDSSVDNIIEIVVKNGLAKNLRQLEFLSKDKHSLDEKLRFTLKPLFGFLFKVETTTKQFFIWELLNSHATYVWEKEINDTEFYQFVEQEISFIKVNGREEYRRYYKSIVYKNFEFHIIEHDGAELTEEERFQAWRNKLEASMLDFA